MSSDPTLLPSTVNWTPATPTLSDAFAVIVTVPVRVWPAVGAVTETVGGVVSAAWLLTVTETDVLVVELPAASRATAVSVCAPLATEAVFHETEYGEAVSSAPRLAPSSLNCTPTTPTLSEAFAVTLSVDETVCPAEGAVIETVGLVVSATWLLTVTETDVLVVEFPAASRATAVSVCAPFAVEVVFHETE